MVTMIFVFSAMARQHFSDALARKVVPIREGPY